MEILFFWSKLQTAPDFVSYSASRCAADCRKINNIPYSRHLLMAGQPAASRGCITATATTAIPQMETRLTIKKRKGNKKNKTEEAGSTVYLPKPLTRAIHLRIFLSACCALGKCRPQTGPRKTWRKIRLSHIF